MKLSTLRKALILLAVMLVAAVPAAALSGSGTSSDPYLLTSYEDLLEIGNYPSAYFKQTADIVVNDPAVFTYEDGVISGVKDGADVNVWTPVDFSGTFTNGSRWYITGLYVTEENANGGLFGTLTNATVNKLYMDFALIEADENAGIIAGKAEGTTTLSSCIVSGSVIGKTTSTMNTVGGMVGTVGKNATVSAGISYADVTGATSYSANVGGVAGINYGTVTGVAFAGKVYGTATYYDASIGGVAGYNTGSVNNCRTEYGTVGGESTALVNDCYVGGIVGLNKGEVENNVNGVAISAKNFSSGDSIVAAGGVVGATIDASIYDNKNTGALSTEYAYAGGIAGVAISDSGVTYVEACLNEGNVYCTYGVAGGIVGRAIAAGEGYVSIVLNITDCYNTGSLNGNAKGEVAGETATVDSAQVNAGEEVNAYSGTCSAGFASVITADAVQYGKTASGTVNPNAGSVRAYRVGTTDRWILRCGGRQTTLPPKPVMVTLITVTNAAQLEILSVDVNGLALEGTTLSGSIVVKIYKPETFNGGTAVAGFSADKKYAATEFVTLKAAAEGRVEEIAIPVSATVAEGAATVTVNALIVDTTDAMNPLCENKKVSK